MTRTVLLTLLVLLPVLGAGCAAEDAPAPAAPAPTRSPTYREDVKELTLAPGKSLEYKVFMQEGAEMDFSWTAPRALHYDFHGDREGDTSGAFTRHKSGTATLDRGAFVSPFQGRHGWYWENRNAQAVTVTLTTKGDYIVVGVVG